MNIIPEMNYYTLSLLMGGVVALVSGLSVYFKGEKVKQNLVWLMLNISTAIWSFGFFFMIVATNSNTALWSARILHFFAIFIPLFYFLFIIHVTNTYQIFKKYFFIGVVVLIAFFLSNLTNLLIKGMSQSHPFNYVAIAGPLYPYFTVYFFTFVIFAIVVLVSKISRTQGAEILRLKYILWASIAGFIGGGSVFFQTFNINIPPYPLVMFSLYPLIIAYAILKHKLFDIKLILVEIAILLLNMFLLFNAFTSNSSVSSVLNISISAVVFLFSIILMRGIYKDIRDREKIEALAKEMEIANERSRMMEGQKTEFVSIASHQLRTPLTVIKGYASMVLEGTFGSISDEVKDAMEKLYKSSEKIVALVEDLLTVSRIEQGRMMLNFETIDFKDFLQRSLAGIADEVKEAKIDLSFNAQEGKEFKVAIDEKKFKQVVAHIIENAIKYTGAQGRIRVTLSEDEITNKIRLSISDTGNGMTAEQIYAVFERFNLKAGIETPVQNSKEESGKQETIQDKVVAESSMMQKRTPGIGLYIAQEIIEAHHGTLHIESAGTDRGTTVIVEFPKITEVKE